MLTERKRTILCFGDSNTYGYDPRSLLGDRYPADMRWTGILSAAGFDVINAGMNGRTIPDSLPAIRLFDQVCRGLPEDGFLFLMLGSNDLLSQQKPSAEVVAARMKAFLHSREAEKQIDRLGKNFILAAPPAMGEGSWVDGPVMIQETMKLGAHYKKIAQELGLSFLDAGKLPLPLCADGVHLSEEGHKIFAEKLVSLLKEL